MIKIAIAAAFIDHFPLIFHLFQMEHYEKRLSETKSISERIFLSGTLAGLKQNSIKFYN